MTSLELNLPPSYETLDLTHIKVSHHPVGAPSATPVVVVTLNRPEKHNAFTPQMADSLTKAYHMFHIDSRVKVVVLTGAGKMFCAGMDLNIGFGDGEGSTRDFRDIGGRVTLAMHRCHKPTIVALQGSAVGVGMTMTLPAVIRICHEKGKYGCCVPAVSPIFWRYFHRDASGRKQGPVTSFGVGSRHGREYQPLASSMSRALMWECPGSPEETHLLESRVFHHMIRQRDYKEGVSSFLEKRKAQFETDPWESSAPEYPWWSEANISLESKVSKHSKL
ncbi:Enoyl-CoA hydratase AKT3-1 [Penicillium macrosclerotiorum]|uniref:Enoyl-CoA hydratase AKT3-1 n=1 Tax=Penicillium macrosclerotiorum TaxID=303699 RepID=UPI0025485FE1|nr:Enoyl-CoA hydratase AKT3-1 [Penicillium macrosclerotiorum]KAJ5666598.1 Enoyl-CoA hydratase AKT3-1 [Penicillium macrosclerotiorum]